MKEPKFTPGPWHDYQYMLASAIEDANARKICDMSESDFSLDEDEANARLIAVAPDMYELLRQVVDIMDDSEDCGEIPVDRINAVLRKVRGESEAQK